MPARENIPTGAPCWVDLTTSDAERARSFYAELFGWTAEESSAEYGGYFNFQKDGVRIGGCMPAQADMVPNVWNVYLTTDDAAKTVEAAKAEGGQVLSDAMAVGELGTMAFVADPGGAGIGVWQPGTHQGFGITGEPGTPAWFELHTRSYQAAVDFYRNVFRWETQTMSDTPELHYTVQSHGEEQLAGVMDSSEFLPEGVPPYWTVYFGVADVDATLAQATELGGTVVAPAEDTPYGRLATAADPNGAQFRVIGPNVATPAQ